jgi:hypothetical protein
MKSRRARPCLAALVLAAAVACGDDGERASESGAERDRTADLGEAAQRLQPGAEAVAGGQPRAADAVKQSRQMTEQQRRRERFAGIDLSEDQQRRLDALDDEQRSWKAEHEEALRRLRDEMRAARKAGDDAALEDARSRMRTLQQTIPTLRGILAELSDEQRAQFERNAQISERPPRPRQQ